MRWLVIQFNSHPSKQNNKPKWKKKKSPSSLKKQHWEYRLHLCLTSRAGMTLNQFYPSW